MLKPITDYSDEELRQIAEGSISTVARLGEVTRRGTLGISPGTEAAAMTMLGMLKDLRDEARASRPALESAGQLIQSLTEQLDRAQIELVEKTTALRLTNPDVVQRRIEDARAAGRDEAVASREAELAALRAEVSRQRSEIEELRANKRKLREVIERLKEDR